MRRDVVVELILEMKRRKHQAYIHIDEKRVREKARLLPENGVPPEVLKVIKNDNSIDSLRPQKAATPVPGRVTADLAFHGVRPNVVVDEMSGAANMDTNEQDISGIQHIAESVGTATDKQRDALSIRTGSEMMYQFQPWFFAVAFAFCFSFATACPDLANRPRHRRRNNASEICINQWCRAIARRVESQFRRDWMLCFVMWNYMFRTAVNLTKATISYAAPRDSLTEWSGTDIELGAKAILKALGGKYRSPCGQLKDVNGDLTKVPYVENFLRLGVC